MSLNHREPERQPLLPPAAEAHAAVNCCDSPRDGAPATPPTATTPPEAAPTADAAAAEAARQRAKRLNFAVVLMLSTMSFSVTPYFSTVARARFGFTAAQVGYIFAAFPLGYLAMSVGVTLSGVFAGVGRGALQRVFRGCIVASTAAMAAFAFVPDLTDDRMGRLVGFAAVRLLCGMSLALVDVCLLVVVVGLFPDRVAAVTGEWEATNALGVLGGPLLGGLLYDYAGGFRAPPLATGAAALVAVGVSYVVPVAGLPGPPGAVLSADGNAPPPATRFAAIRELLALPAVSTTVPWLSFGVAMTGYTFFEALGPAFLTGHYRISAFGVGVVMGVVAVMYATTSVVIGNQLSRWPVSARPTVIAIALACQALSMFMVGPCFVAAGLDSLEIDSFDTNRAVSLGFLCLVGVSLAAVAVTGPASVVDAAKGSDSRIAAAASVTNSFVSVGCILGPVVGGHATDAVGFRGALLWTSVAVGAASLAVVTVAAATQRPASTPAGGPGGGRVKAQA
jgi:MFS family permease